MLALNILGELLPLVSAKVSEWEQDSAILEVSKLSQTNTHEKCAHQSLKTRNLSLLPLILRLSKQRSPLKRDEMIAPRNLLSLKQVSKSSVKPASSSGLNRYQKKRNKMDLW